MKGWNAVFRKEIRDRGYAGIMLRPSSSCFPLAALEIASRPTNIQLPTLFLAKFQPDEKNSQLR